MSGLKVLVVDDERPALDELAYLLERDPRIAEVRTCDSATEVLRLLREDDVDCLFLDIQMPGLTGLELAEVLGRFRTPPPIVFVTAHEGHAVEAFDLRAVDYVLKPVRAERLAEAVRRVVEGGERTPVASHDLQIPVERGGVTRFIDRGDGDPRRGPGRLRAAAHPRREPPDPGAARRRSRRSGATPASCGSTARSSCRSPTSPRSGWTGAAAPCMSATPSPVPTSASAAATRASCATC